MNDIYTAGYAMVGFGNHAVHQLLPAIQYLGLPLRYVCCSSTSKAEAVARKYPGLHGTTSLREVLDDKEIRGVFVAATPSAHFTISRAVLESGKALFVEKPPCTALEQLDRLIETAKAVGNPAVTVGFQRRFRLSQVSCNRNCAGRRCTVTTIASSPVPTRKGMR